MTWRILSLKKQDENCSLGHYAVYTHMHTHICGEARQGKTHKVRIVVVSEGRSPNYGPCGFVVFLMKELQGRSSMGLWSNCRWDRHVGSGTALSIVNQQLLHVCYFLLLWMPTRTKRRNIPLLLPQISFQWPLLGMHLLWSGHKNKPVISSCCRCSVKCYGVWWRL